MNSKVKKCLKTTVSAVLILMTVMMFFSVSASAETIVMLPEKELYAAGEVALPRALENTIDLDEFKTYLRTELIKSPESVDISSFNITYTQANLDDLTNIIFYSLPEMFHIDRVSCSVSGDKLNSLIFTYKYSASEFTQMYNKCMAKADAILDGIESNKNINDIQKALLIHDRLAVQCEYDMAVYTSGTVSSEESFNMYGALENGVAVCQGYAEAYMYLLEKAGIENYLCSSQSLNHVWNIVTINGKKYHVDVTWDDPTYDMTGRVQHTNFMVSSDGIYSSGHSASDYDSTPNDKTYDSYFWQDSETEFQLIGNELYYIDNENQVLKKYSDQSTVISVSDQWDANGSGQYWIGNFARLSSDGANLYYNLSDAVYMYKTSSKTSEIVWNPDLSKGDYFRIFGFTYKDGYLICDVYNSPNFDLDTKKMYQQKYKYSPPDEGVLKSISINNMPTKTEYYIGDSLNTDGLQLKLTYSNGKTEYIKTGFSLSGFDSSSAGSKTVTVSYGGFSESFNVTVKTPAIALNAETVKIELNDSCILDVTTDPANVTVTWSSSDVNVATVADGEVDTRAKGTAVITAAFTYNGKTYSDTCSVNVECSHAKIETIKGTAATCKETGLTDGKKCSVCGEVTEAQTTIAKTAHTEVTVKGKAATCTETGLTDGKKCSVCGEITVAQTTIAKTAHTEVTVNGKDATCSETGLTDGKKCSVCGEVTVVQTTIANTGHTEVTVKGKDATCTETGLTDGKKCSVCGEVTVVQTTIAKTGHTEVTVKGKASTCTETGLTDGKKCSVCGEVTVAQTTIAKTGHTEVTVKGKDATCTETGLTDGKKCSVCGEVTVAQTTIAKTGHKEVKVPGKAATCTQAGFTDGKKCSVCGKITAAQKSIAKTAHKYGEWIVEKPATTEQIGLKVKTCSLCGDKKSENIPKLPAPATKNSLGDVNGDNKITAADARVILRTAAKIDTASESAIAYFDINGDNKITAADARIVLRIAAKLESIDKYIKK